MILHVDLMIPVARIDGSTPPELWVSEPLCRISLVPPRDLIAHGDSRDLLEESRPSVLPNEVCEMTKCLLLYTRSSCVKTCDASCQPSRHNSSMLSFNECEGLSFLRFPPHDLQVPQKSLARTPCDKPSTTLSVEVPSTLRTPAATVCQLVLRFITLNFTWPSHSLHDSYAQLHLFWGEWEQ